MAANENEIGEDEGGYIDLQVTESNRGSVQALLKSMAEGQEHRDIVELILTGCAGDEEARLVAKLLAGAGGAARHLETVEISERLTAAGARELAEALPLAPRMRELLLPLNRLGPAGLVALLEGLRQAAESAGGCQLETLVLARCDIRDAGAAQIASMLPSSLVALHLEGNEIHDEGACLLAKALQHPQCRLQSLGLDQNAIGPAGAAALARAVEQRPGLVVSLDGNPDLPGETVARLKRLDATEIPALLPFDLNLSPSPQQQSSLAASPNAQKPQLSRVRGTPSRSRSSLSLTFSPAATPSSKRSLFASPPPPSPHSQDLLPVPITSSSSPSPSFHLVSFVSGLGIGCLIGGVALVLLDKYSPGTLDSLRNASLIPDQSPS
ncbi:MAG: hypothetical protein Q8P67_19720 [archaeon]|nr:hypothetical protein [archaeon]